MRFGGTATAIALLMLAATVSACGSSSTVTPKQKVTIEIENFGEQVQVAVPRTVEAGVQELIFRNQATGEHSAQLVRFDGKHSPAQVLHAANAWGEGGKPLPDWIHLAGGFGALKSGQSGRGATRLVEGRYLAVDLEAHGKPVYSVFNVVGKADENPLPAAPASIKASEYSFSASGLTQGQHRVLFQNTGNEPHMLAAAPLRTGATLADVRRFIKSEKGKPPIVDSKAIDLAVLDGKGSQTVDLDLEPGKYALLCFVPDRKGGPPHIARGMISAADVR